MNHRQPSPTPHFPHLCRAGDGVVRTCRLPSPAPHRPFLQPARVDACGAWTARGAARRVDALP
eukprot:363610-Chlamydomonas_euryale.AAC.8